VNNLLLPLLIELDLFHVGIAEKVSDPPGLTQRLLGDQLNCFLGACGYTGWIILSAHITFNRFLTVLVGEERAEWACLHAFIAGYAEFPVQSDDTVNPVQCVHRTDSRAGGFLTLAADNRHPDDRMGISYQDPDRAFLRVVDTKVRGGAGQFADMAAGT